MLPYLWRIMKPDPNLADRIAAARILREHHVWAAADSFPAIQDRLSPTRQRFRLLMEAGALLDAVTLLARTAKPPRAIESLAQQDGRWQCTMRAGSTRRRYKGEHADLAAAVLTALLMTFPQRSRRRPGPASSLQPNRSSLHDR